MAIRKQFNKIFGIEDSTEKEKQRFVERVNQIIFDKIDKAPESRFNYEALFPLICFELGVNANDFEKRCGNGIDEDDIPASIRTLTGDDFTQTIQVLCIVYLRIKCLGNNEEDLDWLSESIEIILSQCTCDIGVKWKDGLFYPSGADELDKPLIEETLTWLDNYPNEQKDFKSALQSYLSGKSLPDVIKNCYSALEGIARNILGNQKTLDNNKDELLSKINLSNGWNSILATYIKFAHDYRHASPDRHNITKQKAEAYLYMTGLIIRLLVVEYNR